MMQGTTVTDAAKEYLPHERSACGRTLLAFVLSVLLHLIVLYFLPERLLPQAVSMKVPETVELELTMESVKPEDMRFVEANPEVAENIPDEMRNYSFRNQQAADESAASLTGEEQPKVDGVEPSQKILEGQLASAAVAPQLPAEELSQNTARASAPILFPPKGVERAEFLKEAGLAEMDAQGSGRLGEIAAAASGKLDGVLHLHEPVEAEAAEVTARSGDPTQAKPRPRLDPKLIMGPLMQSAGGASRRGQLAINASFSEFGEYQQQFFAAVVTGWYQDIDYYQPIDLKSRVEVRFTMRSDGTVTNVKAVNSTASEIATVICENAISKPKQFRPWTKEMVEVYGEARELTVLFIYQ